ncbi:T9SS type A sorting domain-containing protein, partial [candidate division WOR-3 bacterium]|nr:T9SS type A sorting domain-containing protein [candidate division WOR-3 bacterium]
EPYPNPFVSATKIAYLCTRPADLRIDIFDVDGRLVRNLPDPNMGQGTQSAVWDGCDDAGRRLAAGVYFVHLETPQGCFTKKIVKLK